MHPLTLLAKKAVEEYVRGRRVVEPPEELTDEMREKAGVFVCLKISGCLRGCIGTFNPVTPSVAHEVIRNAVASATEDPRFVPVAEGELSELEYTVDVLSPPERIEGKGELDPERYGVIVSKGRRTGLLLPMLDGVDTVDEQLSIAKSKACIDQNDEDVDLYRFEVRRYK